eukprot:COSAG01_NODE_66040_length_271_cov_0.901163_1_plen_74_part_10
MLHTVVPGRETQRLSIAVAAYLVDVPTDTDGDTIADVNAWKGWWLWRVRTSPAYWYCLLGGKHCLVVRQRAQRD